MSIFKLYDSDFGVTVDGINYDFDHVKGLQIEDPEETKLVRGGNAKNKVGIVYKEGLSEPKTATLTVLGLPKAIFDLLKRVHAEEKRVDFYCISRSDGSSKIGKNAVLSKEPQQLAVDESTESIDVALSFATFDLSEVHKS